MSLHRENIIWPTRDGTWSIGFYDFTSESWKEDFDYEWDVEYDFSKFNWVSTGHQSSEAAQNAWTGPNPGMHEEIPKYQGHAKECKALDKMAAEC